MRHVCRSAVKTFNDERRDETLSYAMDNEGMYCSA